VAKYLHRDRLAVLVVGNPAEFDKAPASLGAPNKLDTSIPPPPKGLLPEQPGSGAEQ
jgi:hypothetical protein